MTPEPDEWAEPVGAPARLHSIKRSPRRRAGVDNPGHGNSCAVFGGPLW